MRQLNPNTIQESNYYLFVSLFSKQSNLNIDSVDSENKTSLWWAVKNQNIPLINFLLQNNANPHISDSNNYTPLNLAIKLAENFNFQNVENIYYPQIVEILKAYCDSYQNTNNNNSSSSSGNNNSTEVSVTEYNNSSLFNSSSVFDTTTPIETPRSRSNTLHRERISGRKAVLTFLSKPRETKLRLHIELDDEPACTIRCVII